MGRPARIAYNPTPASIRGIKLRRQQLLMIWIGGFVLAVALCLVGPDRFIDACWDLIDTIDATLRDLVAQLGARTYGAVRPLAIAILALLAVACVLAARR